MGVTVGIGVGDFVGLGVGVAVGLIVGVGLVVGVRVKIDVGSVVGVGVEVEIGLSLLYKKATIPNIKTMRTTIPIIIHLPKDLFGEIGLTIGAGVTCSSIGRIVVDGQVNVKSLFEILSA